MLLLSFRHAAQPDGFSGTALYLSEGEKKNIVSSLFMSVLHGREG